MTSSCSESLKGQAIGRRSSSGRTELRDPKQIVGSCDQVGCDAGSLDSPIAGPPKVSDGFEPPEDLFDPLAHPLADCVARPASGARVERRAARSLLILRNMRSNVERAPARQEPRALLALVKIGDSAPDNSGDPGATAQAITIRLLAFDARRARTISRSLGGLLSRLRYSPVPSHVGGSDSA